ncbi:NADH:ubiquinone oxidoreductase subunit 5 (chain L)/Multisubunit Na+/H+ antiporter, MnhA subunit [Amycolatopsis arida]|uniref:NADH:ubiquinone oxidoreductase subunit 5 (Chain L)/Multisubunit Na+/H+ antiporter, MnhA subunit n=1 Tax=Amycolatopsis arida TaxID=587909 RepID=A0A1I6ATT8_9PSEU|nr:proton-conducting transporter membrane subunit [Amycolatopsis arida]TDX97522.1 NADH:ubiquinone oxidoreductase subunit 5 (subunit L)/multisubunit Na+/H+ antiporter MnhA subunit [Amycolatopsis arida]SFQ72100.1 NADH:ubiquinone oxidoreductase subunit 5 (chain L)/Multisubunit Na+/H+ antiporter, MnhA subunit [Amycolatopsis arida]
MSALPWCLVGLPALTGAALVAAAPARSHRLDRAAAPVAVAVAAVGLGLAVAVALTGPAARAPWLAGLPLTLTGDGLPGVLVVMVTAVTLAVLGFAAALPPPGGQARFFGLMLLFAGAMLLAVTADDLLALLLGWEVMGAASYALIGFWWRDTGRVRAATTAFLTTRAADLGLYLAAGAAFAAAGTLDLDRLAALPAPWSHLVVAGVLLAAAGKSAQLPLSFWLSGAMAGPSPVSALLHSATMVAAGGYLVLRLVPALHASGWGGSVAAWLGAATAVVLGAVACAQRDLKQLLAASTSAQLGLLFLAAGTGAVAGGAAHLVAHAAVKSLLFLVAGTWLAVLGTKDLAALRGAARASPVLGGTFAAGALALAGVPPLSLWVTKELTLAGAGPALRVAGLAAAALSAVYAGRALTAVLTGPARERAAVPAGARVALVALAVPAAGAGLVALAWVPSPHPGEAVLAAAVALVALVVAWWWTRRGAPLPRWASVAGKDWLGLRALAGWALVRPLSALARVLAAVDDRLLAAAVAGLGSGTLTAARRLASLDDRGLARAVTGLGDAGIAAASTVDRRWERGISAGVARVGAGGRRLGGLARRPQTGQLHHYYAQAMVVLALLVLALVIAEVG